MEPINPFQKAYDEGWKDCAEEFDVIAIKNAIIELHKRLTFLEGKYYEKTTDQGDDINGPVLAYDFRVFEPE